MSKVSGKKLLKRSVFGKKECIWDVYRKRSITYLSLSVFLVCSLNSANIEWMFGIRMHLVHLNMMGLFPCPLLTSLTRNRNVFLQFICTSCIFSARFSIPTFLKSFYCSVLFSVIRIFLLVFTRYTGTYFCEL